ncbi:MAG: serine hydrolase domain-containing protein [Bacteroidota bacterium]
MMRLPIFVLILSVVLLSCNSSGSEKNALLADTLVENDSIALLFDAEAAAKKTYQFDTFFQTMTRSGFNGAVLVAEYGHVIYQKAFGYADFSKKDTLTTQTAFQLASVSKQFTAMAVMILKEKGKLRYEDSVQRFYPNFPYHGITVRQLLTHRSGLPNYTYFCDKHTDRKTPISNQSVVDLLIQHKPDVYYPPNTHFDYSNTGYCLLAAIVEKASGMPFENFVQANIFKPLAMNHSVIYNKAKEPVIANKAVGYTAGRRRYDNTYLDGVVGDKGVYSTVEDLFKWDMALYSKKLVKQKTLDEAFTPAHKEPKENNYGFGWRIRTPKDSEPIIFHGGWWQGYNAYLMHGRKDHSTIILLSNVTNGSLHRIKELQEILHPSKATATAVLTKNK